jgi:LacI family repressor for deo operon, udp, cdd, tsx, nupC, and nupG
MAMVKKPPTIQDVARYAKVSTATVSRALSMPERVSQSTRKRIEEAVVATGYTLNEAARSLRRQKAKAIVIALPNVGNPFYSTILDAVVSEAEGRGYGVLVANRVPGDATGWLRDYFFSSRADGLLVFDATLDTAELQRLMVERGKLPIVIVCDEVIEPGFNLVTSDNREATGRIVQHLIALGHTRIGMATGPEIHHYPNERILGFREAMQRNGLTIREDWVIKGNHHIRSGFQAGSTFLAMQERPTAMVCANDEMAVGFISRIHQAGLRCPTDVSVVGFDDIDMAAYVSPPLTTMRQKRDELGTVSTAALLDIIEGARDPGQPVRVMLRCELLVRGSTGAPANPADPPVMPAVPAK